MTDEFTLRGYKNREAYNETHRRNNRTYRQRWGRPDYNVRDRMLLEIARQYQLDSKEKTIEFLEEGGLDAVHKKGT